jgi:hypothetical protein
MIPMKGRAFGLTALAWGALATLAVGSAACGKNDEKPPAGTGLVTDAGHSLDAAGSGGAVGDESSVGGSAGAGGSGIAGSGGTSGKEPDASDDGASGAGGSGNVDDGGGPLGGPKCRTAAIWMPLEKEPSIPSATLSRFGGVSVDALAVSWTSAAGEVYVADRLTTHDPEGLTPFGTPVKLSGTFAVDRTAMSPNGLALVAVQTDRAGLVGFTRADRQASWTPGSSLDFQQLKGVFEGGVAISEPVFGADKLSLFFLLTGAGTAPTLFESKWSSAAHSWGYPSSLNHPELASVDASHRRRATGASTDGRTLFFFDEVGGIERATWRDTPDSPFNLWKDIGDFPEGAPLLRCDKLYYQGKDGAGTGLFIAEW